MHVGSVWPDVEVPTPRPTDEPYPTNQLAYAEMIWLGYGPRPPPATMRRLFKVAVVLFQEESI